MGPRCWKGVKKEKEVRAKLAGRGQEGDRFAFSALQGPCEA